MAMFVVVALTAIRAALDTGACVVFGTCAKAVWTMQFDFVVF